MNQRCEPGSKTAQAVYRFGSYSTVDGVAHASIDGTVEGDGSTLFAGAYDYL